MQIQKLELNEKYLNEKITKIKLKNKENKKSFNDKNEYLFKIEELIQENKNLAQNYSKISKKYENTNEENKNLHHILKENQNKITTKLNNLEEDSKKKSIIENLENEKNELTKTMEEIIPKVQEMDFQNKQLLNEIKQYQNKIIEQDNYIEELKLSVIF